MCLLDRTTVSNQIYTLGIFADSLLGTRYRHFAFRVFHMTSRLPAKPYVCRSSESFRNFYVRLPTYMMEKYGAYRRGLVSYIRMADHRRLV